MAFGRQAGAVLVRLCADRIFLAEPEPGKAGGLQASCSIDWTGPAFWAPTDGLVEKMPDGSAEALAEAVAAAGFASRSVWLLISDRLAWQRTLSSAPQPPRLLLTASSSKNRSNILNFSRVENWLSLRLSVPFWAR